MINRENAIKRINLSDFDYLSNHVKYLGEIYCTENLDNKSYNDVQYEIDCVIEDLYLKYLNRSILFTLPDQSKQLLNVLRHIIHLQLTLKTQKLTSWNVKLMVNEIYKLVESTKTSYSSLLYDND